MNYVTLIGAESVESAGHRIASAAEEITRAASQFDSSVEALRMWLWESQGVLQDLLQGQASQILEDYREIEWVEEIGRAEENFNYCAKEGRFKNCDRIVAYPEPGMGAVVPWIAVFEDDQIIARMPAHACSMGYAKTPETAAQAAEVEE